MPENKRRRTAATKAIAPSRHFKSAEEFRRWLEKNHARAAGIWLRIYKKDSCKPSITYAEALDEALCHGWIDGQRKPGDELSWLIRFTPRRPKSAWSHINTRHIERLTLAGVMTAAGRAAVGAAQADGRWAAAYVSSRNANPPADFVAELEKDPQAKTFFQTLNRANIYAIVYRLQTAKKPATRAKRMNLILDMMKAGKKFH